MRPTKLRISFPKVIVVVCFFGLAALLAPFVMFGFSVVFLRDTKFATGFSDNGFSKVEIGMHQSDVERLVGKGLCQDSFYFHYGERCGEPGLVRYSFSPTGTHYDQRVVFYDGDTVVRKISEIYVD